MTSLETLLADVAVGAALTIRYADALIEIAAGFETNTKRAWRIEKQRAVPNGCAHCHRAFEAGCTAECPGLLARRALGVA